MSRIKFTQITYSHLRVRKLCVHLMPKLGVNIDHIATLREVRKGIEPEPVFAAMICEAAGADSIVAHLREDRRHIKERDIYLLKQTVKTKLNLEMSVSADIVNIAVEVKPAQATLVPERRQELTTEGGLNVSANLKTVRAVKHKLLRAGIEVSLFIDPDKKQIDASSRAGIKMIELHTGRYAQARNKKERECYFKQLQAAASYALKKGMVVNAGHGLDYYNVSRVANIRQVEELNIGYSIVCRSALVGLERAVREMKSLIK